MSKRNSKPAPKQRMPRNDLDFLLKTGGQKNWRSGRKWNDRKIRAVVHRLRTQQSRKKIAEYVNMTESGVENLIQELRRAARQNYALDKYLEEGRPLRTGNKVLTK